MQLLLRVDMVVRSRIPESSESECIDSVPKVILFDLGWVLMDFAGLRRLRETLPGSVSLEGVQSRGLLA